ncbi:MAG: CDP-glycerol glycerophosphotransferase family protein, partial [Pseudomonadales bacterium]
MSSFARAYSLILFLFSRLFWRHQSRFLFGAWHGDRYADNPRYLLEYLADRVDTYELIWCGKVRPPLLPSKVRFVRYGSIENYWMALTAGTSFFSHSFKDVTPLNLLMGCRIVDLGHGFAIKHMGDSSEETSTGFALALKRLVRLIDRRSHWIVSSDAHAEKLLSEYKRSAIVKEQIVRSGQPRFDVLHAMSSRTAHERIRHKLENKYSLPLAGPLVTYMPTFRDQEQRTFSFDHVLNDPDVLSEIAKLGVTIVEKGHPVESGEYVETRAYPDWYRNMSATKD